MHMEPSFSISLMIETGFSHINSDPDHLMGFTGTPVYSLPTNSNKFVKSLYSRSPAQ